jgi:DNA-directed RNA polymerase subunit RPC12/RpoP
MSRVYKVIGTCPDCKLSLSSKDIHILDIDERNQYRYIMCPRCNYRLAYDKGGRLKDD